MGCFVYIAIIILLFLVQAIFGVRIANIVWYILFVVIIISAIIGVILRRKAERKIDARMERREENNTL